MKSFSEISDKNIGIFKSKLNSELKVKSFMSNCLICGKSLKENHKSFHKSHNIPRFVLNNIKSKIRNNDMVLSPNALINNPFVFENNEIGINKAGVFYCICSKCDQELFYNYEDEKFLLTKEPKDIVDSIALKTYISEYYYSAIRDIKTKINESNLTDDDFLKLIFKSQKRIDSAVARLDMVDFLKDIDYSLKSLINNYKNFDIIYHTILNYTIPLAAQVAIPITKNVDFSILQSIESYRFETIMIGLFPLKSKSVIIIYSKIGNKIGKKYAKQLKKLCLDDILNEIFYLLIRYKSINYFISPLLKKELENEHIKYISSIEDTIFDYGKHKVNISDYENISIKEKLPRILSEEFSLQNLKTKN